LHPQPTTLKFGANSNTMFAIKIAGVNLNDNSNRIFDIRAQHVQAGVATDFHLVKCNMSHWGGVK